MPSHTEAEWLAELAAFAPHAFEEPPRNGPWSEDESMDALRAESIAVGERLHAWQIFVAEHLLAVPLEQCAEDGDPSSLDECEEVLRGCPVDVRRALTQFVEHCPALAREYLTYRSWLLVRAVRQRRTGHPDWHHEPASGSPEMLASLMFRWGPRHSRHRWTW